MSLWPPPWPLGCLPASLPPYLGFTVSEHVPAPKGRYQGVTAVRNHHGVLVCIQVPTRQPHSLSSELTGNCTLLAPDLRPRAQVYFSNLGTEIAIVLDGSGSIEPPDFQKAKDFIYNMMTNFYQKCFECRFAVVQYGEVIQTELDLLDSQDITASLDRVKNITQVKKVTKTASAMQHVLDNIFTPNRGSRAKASKVMLVLTDGDIFQDPLNLTTVINSPKMRGVERFAIGVRARSWGYLVGEAFNKSKAYNELKLIASDPDEDHAFKVTNYMALDGLLNRLQESIIRVEGTVGDALHYQLAQVGFSAQILDEMASNPAPLQKQVLLGTVGAFDWSGGALLYNTHSCNSSFLNQTAVDTKSAQYAYLGYSVAVLHKESGLSYLAGAPRHKQRGAVFELQNVGRETNNFVPVLEGEQLGSYFGSELCPVDVDMDGITDLLLVAAPFYHIQGEEGRVYMYRVNKQRIRASAVAPGLQYFGTSVAGGLDFNGDGLADITVGALGRATVLRSRPVVYLKVSMNFTPKALPIGFSSSVNVSLCFEINSTTLAAESGLGGTSLNFTLDVDVVKPRKRLQHSDKRMDQSSLRELGRGPRLCESFSLIPTDGQLCQEDCFSNITVKVSYHLQTPEGRMDQPQPILDFYAEPSAIFQLPYEKNCKNKLFCVAELELATTISQQELVVGLTKELTMNIGLTNSGEDSYMTRVALNFPRNLQFKRIQKANFSLVWQLEESVFPNRTADITVMVTKPSVTYMNINQGSSHHKEFLFNIHGENLFGAEFQLQICVPVKLRGLQFLTVTNLTKTQVHRGGSISRSHIFPE
ncbi:hypothetical protein Celaphus_00000870 [Cervus elaphus hippelaphus]|uniref:VWFA domain-containing protein n=1 Tax=Cervus elaphus hippelaphus TaxID=46360 RepID=A0A212D7S7_CEREH|nr:hypothetical protein Celaphus_00000870 [Cervus elaphus hippelaphus]